MAAIPGERPPLAEVEEARALYERHAARVLALCVRELRSREDAEDAVQVTFVNALRALRRGVRPRFEEAWLYAIARNVCLTHLRSARRRRRVEAPADLHLVQETVPARTPDTGELMQLREVLDRMPENQRSVLVLREWRGLSYAEIATELGLSQSAVEALLFRARRTLARGLEEHTGRKTKNNRISLVALLKSLLGGAGAKFAATTAAVVTVGAVTAASPAVGHHDRRPVARAHSTAVPVVAAPVVVPSRPVRTRAAKPVVRATPVAVVAAPVAQPVRHTVRTAPVHAPIAAPKPVAKSRAVPVEPAPVAPPPHDAAPPQDDRHVADGATPPAQPAPAPPQPEAAPQPQPTSPPPPSQADLTVTLPDVPPVSVPVQVPPAAQPVVTAAQTTANDATRAASQVVSAVTNALPPLGGT